jgi:outer membrane protein, multidrug efflux system
MHGTTLSWLVVLLLMICGCTVGPDYRRPGLATPGRWAQDSKGVSPGPLVDVQWWTLFKDPELTSLIQRAVLANHDLRIALGRVRQARAERAVAAGRGYPEVDATGSYTLLKRNFSLFGAGAGGAGGAGTGTGGISGNHLSLYQLGLDATWELDVFGGIRRAVEAADANVAASVEGLRDTLVTLLGEVATDYISVRGNQRRIEIALQNVEVERQTVALVRGQLEAGLGTSLQVAQAEALLAATEAQILPLQTSVKRSIHALGVLLAVEPEALLEELQSPGAIPPEPPDVPIGLPSDLLRRRPDVRRAERQLAASNALIGAAVAALFPAFSLTGAAGYQATRTSQLFTSKSTFWNVGPSITWPLWNAGRYRAQVQVQTALQEQALAAYEKTVLTALQDVEDALVSYANGQAARDVLNRQVAANQQASDIAEDLYRRGLVDFLNVLQSQGSLYQAQDLFAQNEQQVATSLVALFKALGGGWEAPPEPTAEQRANQPATASRVPQ